MHGLGMHVPGMPDGHDSTRTFVPFRYEIRDRENPVDGRPTYSHLGRKPPSLQPSSAYYGFFA
jgi:hypothetical protein